MRNKILKWIFQLLNNCLTIASFIRYSLEENSCYARRPERSPLGGLDKEVFKGNYRDMDMDEMSAEIILKAGAGAEPNKQ